MKCQVRKCGRSKKSHPNISFHRFPVDLLLQAQWIDFCNVGDDWILSEAMRICSVHFEESAFVHDGNNNRLRKTDAVPTVSAFLIDIDRDSDGDDNYPISLSTSLPLYSCPSLVDHSYANLKCAMQVANQGSSTTEGSIELIGSEGEPISLVHKTKRVRKRSISNRYAKNWKGLAIKWKKEALSWKAKFRALEEAVDTEEVLKGKFRPDQISKVTGKVKQVKEWSNETITEGLRMRFACGAGYEQLLKLPYVALPSVRTLVRRIQEIHFDSGFLHEVLDILKLKVAMMSSKELDCGIVLDEMSLDEANKFCPNNQKHFGMTTMPPSDKLATHGLVFMIVGMHSRWKQVISYEFVGNTIPGSLLKEAVDRIIINVESFGLKVRFVTSDCGSSNKAMWQSYGLSTKKETALNNWTTVHPVDKDRFLEFIPDPVHLFKSIVNGFISNQFFKVPSWYTDRRRQWLYG
ncbi:uncharacterized protein LOC129771167 isoform X2 [Toxorhynchites rutilus septentrionalis]|uniref:uncharacterized protein LOC129771167 isoform X2 n=1 Tax=Toxorhynchites rutilus septentrionalis TaxID=329112 RepID=UPI00247AC139|nr:uncharacterized protein LOC129771167 isoform X2 [Toxorhynchites rutilus septentrionalis]